MTVKTKGKLQFKVVCPKCLRIYIQPVPLVSKENEMKFKCEKCDIILARFELSK